MTSQEIRSNLLQNKVALITGSGRGIGRTIARLFVAEGASVFLTARTEAELQRAESEHECKGFDLGRMHWSEHEQGPNRESPASWLDSQEV